MFWEIENGAKKKVGLNVLDLFVLAVEGLK